MLTDEQATKAATLIWRCWKSGSVMKTLPADLKPSNRADAYKIQKNFEAWSAKPIVGWKIAATSSAGQQHIGVSAPIAGRLLFENTFESGRELFFGVNRMAVAEAEFAFCMAVDLPPKRSIYSQQEVVASIESPHPAIEIPDSRFVPFESAGEAQLIADNACTRDFILGPPMPENWRNRDLSKQVVEIRAGDAAPHVGNGANVLGSPFIALTWIVNELSSFGLTLEAGKFVTTGTCTVPVPIQSGDMISATFGDLGDIYVRFRSAN